MNYTWKHFFILILVIFPMIIYSGLSHARTIEEIEDEVQALETEIETADMSRMLEIMGRMQELAEEALDAGQEKLGPLTAGNLKPADTPEEEIKRRREIMNLNFNAFKSQSPRASDKKPIEIPEAFPLTGLIIVNGGFKSTPHRGWIWTDYSYQVVEEFVGNLIVNHEYSLKQGKFTGNRNYSFDTISTNIDTKYIGGRKCLKASYYIPGSCTEWESFTKSEVSDNNRYGHIHSWVVKGRSEDDSMKIEVESPDVLFTSVNQKAKEALGCFGTEWHMTKDEFEALLDRDEIRLTKEVGSTSQATPGCKPGSSIILYLRAKTPECHINYTTDPTVIYACDNGAGIAPAVGLKAFLKKGTARKYRWSITQGEDKIYFKEGGENPTTREVSIKARAPSALKDDVGLEVEIEKSDGTRCVATLNLTVKKPTALKKLSDSEASTFGVTPYIDFAAECAKPSGCIKSPIPIPGNPDIVDGYARVTAHQVLDQFYEPILRDPMIWLEKRSTTITEENGTTRTIQIESLDENPTGTQVPVVPGQATPTIRMSSNHGMTEGGGLLLDNLAIMYPEGWSVPIGLEFKIDQNIQIFDCPVARCVQHFKKTDAAQSCVEP